MITNNVNFNITDAEVESAITKMKESREVISHYLIASLTPEQRRSLFKMGKDSVQYMNENFNYGQDADLRSPTLDATQWGNDVHTTQQLQKVFNALEPYFYDVLDMMTIAGNEAMEQAQVNYRYIRYKANEGEPKARGAYESLKNLRWNPTRSKSNSGGSTTP